tara:strand:+ start:754 stop:906 length:153 start_codon:yes stop_codon:yes gene_type:complete
MGNHSLRARRKAKKAKEIQQSKVVPRPAKKITPKKAAPKKRAVKKESKSE